MKDSDPACENETRTDLLTVILAEDDPFVRELCGAKLRAEGHRVVEATSGDQALPLLLRGEIDVLVTDICMPGALDGWSLAEQARLSHPLIAIVYASSRPADATLAVSGSLYLRKPYRPDAIIAAIRQLTFDDSAACPDKTPQPVMVEARVNLPVRSALHPVCRSPDSVAGGDLSDEVFHGRSRTAERTKDSASCAQSTGDG